MLDKHNLQRKSQKALTMLTWFVVVTLLPIYMEKATKKDGVWQAIHVMFKHRKVKMTVTINPSAI
jgi:hypothetical protein